MSTGENNYNGLASTPRRRALLREIADETGDIYCEAHEVWSRHTGGRVTERVREMLNAGWIRTREPNERTKAEWSDQRVYYRVTDIGEKAMEHGRG